MSIKCDSPYAWYVAALLAMSYAVAFIDRQVLNLLVDPIKGDLGLTDTQISLIQGLAFASAYVSMGFVFGRLADRTNRRNLLILGVTLWCASTVMCGFVHDFVGLFAARAGVGAAEACLLPAGWSLLADYFSREKLPRAMSIFLLGPFVGGGLALIFGGLTVKHVAGLHFTGILAGLAPWKLTFVFIGAPGLLFSLLLLTVREPARPVTATENRPFTLAEALQFFWAERQFYARFLSGMALVVVTLYSLPAWTPAFLMRDFGATPAQVGIQYGLATLIAGCLGVLVGPWLSRRLMQRYPLDAPIRTAFVAAAGAVLPCLVLAFAGSYWIALAASVAGGFFVNLSLPVAAAALQSSAPNRMRGLVTSAYALVLSSVGLGVAPTLVALVTDKILHDPKLVGVALGCVCAGAALLALPLLRGAAERATITLRR